MAGGKEKKQTKQRTETASSPANALTTQIILDCLCSPAFAEQILSAVNPVIEKLMVEINSVKETVAEQTAELGQLREKVRQQEERIKTLEEEKALKDQPGECTIPTVLRVTGLPTDEAEASEAFLTVVNDKMGMEMTQSDFNLRAITSATPANSGEQQDDVSRKAPFITSPAAVHQVTFSSPANQQRCYRSRVRLKGTDVFVSEDLPAIGQQIFYQCRQLKKKKKIATTWTYQRKIFIKTHQGEMKQINSVSELEEIINDKYNENIAES